MMEKKAHSEYGDPSDKAQSTDARVAELIWKGISRSIEYQPECVSYKTGFNQGLDSYKNPHAYGLRLEKLDQDILGILELWGKTGPKGIFEQCHVSQPTIQRHLKELIDRGYIQKSGSTRGVRYWLTPHGKAALKKGRGD